jgi:hypothetical protein
MKGRTVALIVVVAAVAVVLAYRSWLEPSRRTSVPVGSAGVSVGASVGASVAGGSPADARAAILERDRAVTAALAAKDIATLSRFVHPSRGVRISHYTYVRPDSDAVFSASGLREAWESPQQYLWGYADGTGDPIRMSLRAYLEKFYSRDFSTPPRLGYDTTAIGTGNALNNIADIYPRAIRVEHHFPGFDPKYGGMDWQSLWLIYEKYRGEWYLVGIARGVWTI